MRPAYRVADVRAAEAAAMAAVGDEALMARASWALAITCARLLRASTGGVAGRRVAVVAGSGSNGGDALWAGAHLARRGAQVHAIALSPTPHAGGMEALLGAGGRLAGDESAVDADLVIDGIVGIGGRGALRPDAVAALGRAAGVDALVVACDLPSGLDADTGAVADEEAVVAADVTVTFGALKPGLLLRPDLTGVVELVDIGLELNVEPAVRVVGPRDAAAMLPVPGPHDHKYSRGVVAVVAGSAQYPGAGILVAGGARCGGAGMVRVADPLAIERFPDVVLGAPDGRTTAIVVGPGLAGEAPAPDVLSADVPVLLDATALRWVADSPAWRSALAHRAARGAISVLTPHDGEFAALGGQAGEDRIGAVRSLAAALGAVVLLKGSTTIVATPAGEAWVNAGAPPALATAGSGDVLSGLAGSMLAANRPADAATTARIMAAAAVVHALAGRVAGEGPVGALEVLGALAPAVELVREAGSDAVEFVREAGR